ncbi:hypothetical protein SAY87_016945 [Trapa incisa]|uniref:Uncharacterized protein n=1 Tax=Trapa incisa TaxID=236973 RepID=A0AAN7LAZ8_9MYRT|nr:hypothetical protein SAY87_016945 [Trapa incisa]
MADSQRSGHTAERDIEQIQAITTLKKGSYLLKYGRRGKPKFYPFHLSNDESALIWYSGKEEKHIKLSQVSRIIPGQRTAIFQRYPRPEKEYQSFSLICTDRSLDLICKDKDEAEVWLVGLKAVISRGNIRKWRNEATTDSLSLNSPTSRARRNSPSVAPFDSGDGQGTPTLLEISSRTQTRMGKEFPDIISYIAATKSNDIADLEASSFGPVSAGTGDNSNGRNSASEAVRISLSSAVSSSSQGSYHEDFDSLGDVLIWGEGVGDGILGGGEHRVGSPYNKKMDATLPKALYSTVVLDVHNIACGGKHAVLVNRQGEIFSWGEELGGRLGHGTEFDVSYPKIIDTLSGMSIELVACGEYHTCAVTHSGELYTWGDGAHNSGLLGHGSQASHWVPKRVGGCLESLHVSYIACGPWHTAVVTSSGQIFTFGDGAFGALGHSDRSSSTIPREVEALKGFRATRVACGVWHTAAIVEITIESSSDEPPSKHLCRNLYTWGDGDKYQLGHGDREPRLLPHCVTALADENICQVACGHNMTVVLTATGKVYTMGSPAYGQLGSPAADGKAPVCVEGKLADIFVEEVACGSYHVAVLTSKSEIFTWGKGSNGQLGHGDHDNRSTPTMVYSLKDKQVKAVMCGSNLTAVICLHKWVSSIDHSMCSGCHNPFGFRRKRHNCYNCGLVFCKACSSRKSVKASLAPNMNKPYRVCDDCYNKLKNAESSSTACMSKLWNGNIRHKTNEAANKEASSFKPRRHLSRLLSSDSISPTECRMSINDSKFEQKSGRIFPYTNINLQIEGMNTFKEPTSPMAAPIRKISFSVPASRMPSRPASPLSWKSSPHWISDASQMTIEDSKRSNDSMTRDIMNLRTQVEDLTSKSHHLQSELEKTARRLKEVTAIASNEAKKCKTAKEVIKSLTAQLKEMTERLPDGQCEVQISRVTDNELSSDSSMISNETHPQKAVSQEVNSKLKSVNMATSNGSKPETDKGEWVIQDEPGVYLTLAALPSGGNELRRVRFSRKHFSQDQAEKWWSDNVTKVHDRHKIFST